MSIHLTGGAVLIGVILVGLWLLTQFMLVPYIRLELRRRASRQHAPQPEELWIQDGQDLLYIDAVTPLGVEILMFNEATKTAVRWRDTWAEWGERLRARTVIFTGQRRPLGSA